MTETTFVSFGRDGDQESSRTGPSIGGGGSASIFGDDSGCRNSRAIKHGEAEDGDDGWARTMDLLKEENSVG